MTIDIVNVKCAFCGKKIEKLKRLVDMCENNFCDKDCRQKYRKTINVKQLCIRYGKSVSYFHTILCRPEFNQFKLQMPRNKLAFHNHVNFHKMLKFYMKRNIVHMEDMQKK